MMTNQIFDFTQSMKEVKDGDSNPSVRFLVHIDDSDVLTTTSNHFDTRFKNSLQDLNL